MKSLRHVFFLAVTLAAILSGCKSPDAKIDGKKEAGAWPDEMEKMAKDVRDLIPFVYDREAFHAPQNRQKISGILKSFVDHAHKITPQMGTKLLGEDPMVDFSIDSLETDLKRASQAFELNQVEYSRTAARSSLNHCFLCHSVAQIGPAAHWDLSGLNRLELSPIEKADLLVASHNYDRALQQMEKLIGSDEFLTNHPFDYESLLRRYLALMIRVENDPIRAEKEIAKVEGKSGLPHYILAQVHGWRLSLQQWIRENKHTRMKNSPLKQAADRIERATRLQQYPQDHAGDVEYLRATAILHDFLKRSPKAEEQAQALLLLGRAYEVMDELGSWNLHEVYFEACIRKAPKSAWAKTCYARLEASVLQGYSGSSGTHIPGYESDKLKSLKDML